MEGTDLAARMEQRFTEAVAPVRAELAEVEAQINELEQELARLRALRTRGRNVLKQLDPDAPELVKETRRKHNEPLPKRLNGKPYSISEEKLTTLTEWLEAHRQELEGEELWVSGVLGRDDFDAMSHQTLNVGLQVLADRGFIRLDSVGMAGRRTYRLNPKVAAAK